MGHQMLQTGAVPEDPKQPGKPSGGKAFFVLFLMAFVLGFGALGGFMFYSAHMQEALCSASAEGEVVRYQESRSRRKNRHTFSPVVEYRAGEEAFTGTANTWTTSRPFQIGEYVSIGYNPKRPEEFYIKGYSLKATYQIGAAFLSVSIGIAVVSILCAALGRANMEKEKKGQVQAAVLVSGMALLMFVIFSLVMGLGAALGIFAAMGLFTLFGLHQNKKKK